MTSRALSFLRREHRRAFWIAPLWLVAVGMAVVWALGFFEIDALIRGYAAGVSLVFALFIRLLRRPTLRRVARRLDARMRSHSRFEAVAEIAGRTDPLAQAIVADADQFLAQHRPPRPLAWSIGVALAGILALGALFWSRDPGRAPAVASAASLPTSLANVSLDREQTPAALPPPPAPAASLRWIAPRDEVITPSPAEPVPLSLEADSITGLRAVTLHVLIDGESLPPTIIAQTLAAGVQGISAELAVDTLASPASHFIAFYFAGERIRPSDAPPGPAWPMVVSPLRFLNLQPLADPPVELPSDDPAIGLLQSLRELNVAQRQAMQETFALLHPPDPRDPADQPPQPSTVATRPAALAEATATLLATASTASVSADSTSALEQAQAALHQSAELLSSAQFEPALLRQSRALAALGAAHAAIHQHLREELARRAAEDAARQQRLAKEKIEALPAREQTPGGRLEKFALEQRTIAERLAARTQDPDLFAAQDRIARGLASLAAENALPGPVQDSLATAATAAREAAKQLNEQDSLAATEPATRAAQSLAEAVAAMDSAGRERATETLLAAQREFIRAATLIEAASTTDFPLVAQLAREAVATLHAQLRLAARHEQEKGSAAAAEQLEQLAQAAQPPSASDTSPAEKSKDREDTQKNTAKKLDQLAQRAADAAGQVGDRQKIQQRAAAELARLKESLRRAQRSSAELAEVHRRVRANAQHLRDPRPPPPPPPGPGSPRGALDEYAARLAPRIDGLLQLATEAVRNARRAQMLTTANPAEAPPAYRGPVADYFESLARDRSPPSSPR